MYIHLKEKKVPHLNIPEIAIGAHVEKENTLMMFIITGRHILMGMNLLDPEAEVQKDQEVRALNVQEVEAHEGLEVGVLESLGAEVQGDISTQKMILQKEEAVFILKEAHEDHLMVNQISFHF